MKSQKHSKPKRLSRRRNRAPIIVPKELGGKWIAWNSDRSAIIGSGESLKGALAAARSSWEPDPGFEWAPAANHRLLPHAVLSGSFSCQIEKAKD